MKAKAKAKSEYPQIQRFQGTDGQWYWRCAADNGWSVTIGGEGFSRKRDIPRTVKNAAALLADAIQRPIVDVKAPRAAAAIEALARVQEKA